MVGAHEMLSRIRNWPLQLSLVSAVTPLNFNPTASYLPQCRCGCPSGWMGNENLPPAFADQRHRRGFLSAASPASQNVRPGSKRIDQRQHLIARAELPLHCRRIASSKFGPAGKTDG